MVKPGDRIHLALENLRDTRNKTPNMVFEGEFSVKLHTADHEVGTSTNGNPRQDQVTIWGGYTVLDLLTTPA